MSTIAQLKAEIKHLGSQLEKSSDRLEDLQEENEDLRCKVTKLQNEKYELDGEYVRARNQYELAYKTVLEQVEFLRQSQKKLEMYVGIVRKAEALFNLIRNNVTSLLGTTQFCSQVSALRIPQQLSPRYKDSEYEASNLSEYLSEYLEDDKLPSVPAGGSITIEWPPHQDTNKIRPL